MNGTIVSLTKQLHNEVATYITAKGPSLPFPNPLDDTRLTVVSGGVPIEENSGSKGFANRGLIEAITLALSSDFEAANVATLQPDSCTALLGIESGNPRLAIGDVFYYRRPSCFFKTPLPYVYT